VLILDSLVKEGKASWNKSKQICTLYWYSLDEWASIISKWIFDTGKTGTVCTLYEILHGDDAVDQGKHRLMRFL
jgi:ESCRT-II complex subunit VPS25